LLSDRRRKLFLIAAAVFVAVILFAGGCGIVKNLFSARQDRPGPSAENTSLSPGVGPDAFADVVARSSPAVVKISARVNSPGSGIFFSDQFFRQFFGFPPGPGRQEEGLGSGFIISRDGYILTNEHVVDGANEIIITVAGFDKELRAEVVGADYDLDLALLKIDAGRELPSLTLGNSDQIRVGNWVIAIGNPYGLDHTVTTGVISAKGRPISVNDRHYENLLQTDASINPGNSGGPLLNLQGEVIGINTAINAQAQGIGFAIPASTVLSVLEDLKNGANKTARPWIGVQVRNLDRETASYLGLEKAEGAVVAGIVPGSPAEKAGMRQWDVIVEFNGKKVGSADDLVPFIKQSQVGGKVKVVALRRRQALSFTVTVAEKPKNLR